MCKNVRGPIKNAILSLLFISCFLKSSETYQELEDLIIQFEDRVIDPKITDPQERKQLKDRLGYRWQIHSLLTNQKEEIAARINLERKKLEHKLQLQQNQEEYEAVLDLVHTLKTELKKSNQRLGLKK